MGQQANRSNQEWDVLDTVITNALIVDAVTGIIKADIGIKVNSAIHAILWCRDLDKLECYPV